MSDGITVDVLGNKAILDNLDAFGAEIAAKAQALLEEAGQMALDEANANTPVLTGYLKSRNQLDVQPGVVTIGNDAEYAMFVELGTYKMAAQPFLVPAWIDAGAWLEAKLSGILGG